MCEVHSVNRVAAITLLLAGQETLINQQITHLTCLARGDRSVSCANSASVSPCRIIFLTAGVIAAGSWRMSTGVIP